MDIYSKNPGAAGALSNFYPYQFSFDGVECASMEGLLQALLVSDVERQKQICGMVGREAKDWGAEQLVELGEIRRLWWGGKEYDRYSIEYQDLIDGMYDALAKNQEFKSALLSTGDELLTHSIASAEGPAETILTEEEFCLRLMSLRNVLKASV